MDSSSNKGKSSRETPVAAMATALSIDADEPPISCRCERDPNLSVQFISTKNEQDGGAGGLAISARRQEIFLDFTCLLASHNQDSVSFVLDERFDSFLDKNDRQFKESILELLEKTNDGVRSTRAYKRLENFLRDKMGYSALGDGFQRRLQRIQQRQEESTSESEMSEVGSSPQPTHAKDQRAHNKSTAGHVFCINGSVCDLACDAFLCPSVLPEMDEDSHYLAGNIFARWRRHQMSNHPSFWSALTTFITDSGHISLKRYPDYPRAATLLNWPWSEFQDGTINSLPLFVAGRVDFTSKDMDWPSVNDNVDFLIRTLRDALEVANYELQKHQPQAQHKRERHLIAVPVLGTGGGGASDLTGLVVDRTLQVLHEFATRNEAGFDYVLVAADAATYTNAQLIRYQKYKRHASFRAVMDNSDHYREAKRLADLSNQQQLSLFLGAGTSVGSGLPTWFQFLNVLEDSFTNTGSSQERTLGDTTGWNPLAMAESLEKIAASRPDRYGCVLSLKKRVERVLCDNSRSPGLLLYILLGLSPTSIVTQNYDRLIERAFECRNPAEEKGQRKEYLSVIPYQPKRGASCWLLKMHGCVSNPDEIVLTASDYQNYEAGRLRALSGLVQANLMTTHFLFVGFSLTDPNYLRIVKEVRHALNPGSNS